MGHGAQASTGQSLQHQSLVKTRERYKVDEAEKEAVKEKRRKQLDEIMKKQEQELEETQVKKKTFAQALYYPDSDDEDAITSAPVIEEIESTSFAGHWEESESASQYTVEEYDELEGMEMNY